ncbi:MAG: HEAT repeat domain-containing protein [Sedimentisphaerales bacterium]|nr:HEAT repeat domain-containing protein [Sedimentisphaerales bacterium]
MSIDVLVQQIKSINWDAPTTAAGIGVPAVSTLYTLAKDENPQVRQLTLACLEAIGGDKAVEIAMDRLYDSDAEVVAEAVGLLHTHPPTGHEADLFQAYKKVKDAFAQEQIPIIAGRIDSDVNKQLWFRELQMQEEEGKVDDSVVIGDARLGNESAREQFVHKVLAAKGRRSPEWIDRCRYMEDTWIVPHMVPLLDRTEMALNLFPDNPDYYLRTCDLAVEVIVELTGADVGFPVKRVARYTGPELAKVKQLALSYK